MTGEYMPNVMIRRAETGDLRFYIAKRDLEETIVSMEYNTLELWGGQMELADGSRFYVEPKSPPPVLPVTVRAKRI
jgi:nitrogen fixation protein NifT